MAFYFHFLRMDSGTRAWRYEVSLIDTALLVAGMLTAAAYLGDDASKASFVVPTLGTLAERRGPFH